MILQNCFCQAWVRAAASWVKPLVGLILCLVRKRRALQSTDRHTPKRFQQRKNSCYTGEKSRPSQTPDPTHQPINPSQLLNRSSDEWLVGEAKRDALLKAPIGVDPNQPPSAGWQFYSKGKYKEDANLTCSNQVESPCLILRVSLSGEAKRENSACVGMYGSTGLISMGRQVKNLYAANTSSF